MGVRIGMRRGMASLTFLLAACGTAPPAPPPPPPVDAGTGTDAGGTMDAGRSDAGRQDAGAPDAGPVDAGSDAGPELETCDDPITSVPSTRMPAACTTSGNFFHTLGTTSFERPTLATSPHDVLMAAEVDGRIHVHRLEGLADAPIDTGLRFDGNEPRLIWSERGQRFGLTFIAGDRLVLVELDPSLRETRRLDATFAGSSLSAPTRPYWTGCHWMAGVRVERSFVIGAWTAGGGWLTTKTYLPNEEVSLATSGVANESVLAPPVFVRRERDLIFHDTFDERATFVVSFGEAVVPHSAATSMARLVSIPGAAFIDWPTEPAPRPLRFFAVIQQEESAVGSMLATWYRSLSRSGSSNAGTSRAPPERFAARAWRLSDGVVAGSVAVQGYTTPTFDTDQHWYVHTTFDVLRSSSSGGGSVSGIRVDDSVHPGAPLDAPVVSDLSEHQCGAIVAYDTGGVARVGLFVIPM